MTKEDLGDRIDNAVVKIIRSLWVSFLKHAWLVAEHIFKIVSWTFIVGIIGQLSTKIEILELKIANGLLTLVLFSAVFSSLINVALFIQDVAIENFFSAKISRFWAIFWTSVTSLLVLYIGLGVIMPMVFSIILVVLKSTIP